MNTTPIANVVAPGVHLKREMNERGWSQADLAEILGRPLQTVNQILKGKKAIIAATARELEDATGISAETWLNLESLYRVSLAACGDQAVAQRAELFTRVPIADLRRRGWVRDTRDIEKLKHDVLKLLRIKSLDAPSNLRFAARKATGYEHVLPEQEAWVCRARTLAEGMTGLPKFSPKRFEAGLPTVRNLGKTIEGMTQIPGVLHKLGIRFLVVEHLPRTKIDGATFWLTKTQPVVALSFRYARLDHFLFTLFHELSHVRNGDALSIDNDILASTEDNAPACEVRANTEAADLLVPPDALKRFLTEVRGTVGKHDILRFASQVGIHPGVVLGQLQHRGVVGWSACRELLVPVRDLIIKSANTDGWDRRMKILESDD